MSFTVTFDVRAVIRLNLIQSKRSRQVGTPSLLSLPNIPQPSCRGKWAPLNYDIWHYNDKIKTVNTEVVVSDCQALRLLTLDVVLRVDGRRSASQSCNTLYNHCFKKGPCKQIIHVSTRLEVLREDRVAPDRLKDGRTRWRSHSMYRASIASRGKNCNRVTIENSFRLWVPDCTSARQF